MVLSRGTQGGKVDDTLLVVPEAAFVNTCCSLYARFLMFKFLVVSFLHHNIVFHSICSTVLQYSICMVVSLLIWVFFLLASFMFIIFPPAFLVCACIVFLWPFITHGSSTVLLVFPIFQKHATTTFTL